MIPLRNLKLVVGSGLRNIANFAPVQLYGSSTSTSENWAFDGIGNAMRMSPFLSSRSYARRRAFSVDTSALGQVAPSLRRKIGSKPSVFWKRLRMLAGVTVQPSVG